jgi:hypothetical protein
MIVFGIHFTCLLPNTLSEGVVPAAGTKSAPVGTAGRFGFRSLIGPMVIPDVAAACAASAVQGGEAAMWQPGQQTSVRRAR